MSDMMDIIRKYLSEKFSVDDSAIRPAASVTELGLDSLALLELIAMLEEDFGISLLEQDDLTPSSTLGQIAAALEARTAVGARS
ncbi:acyl carrier protein [Streptomyces diastatochromogenes]|uniref:Carrier domain-containing protein n=1 Tax=Streptomyces diastatochromogenes TaxID=42236 RepID=A0A233RRU3_STRDA|nr:acyl carrier protein [Streptomyces diastatochromogenes]MCZ0984576.1 acyl carrier protein [Streptomyces diastatochromogenes]OXY86115.1 hypothetical protein BEK98_44915 [Streptomyces diastatochromogenes]